MQKNAYQPIFLYNIPETSPASLVHKSVFISAKDPKSVFISAKDFRFGTGCMVLQDISKLRAN